MSTSFVSPSQEALFNTVTQELEKLGYHGELLQRSYTFEDWFSARVGQSASLGVVDAAAFGRSPPSYTSACFAIQLANGLTGPDLLKRYRAVGAPLAFEVE